MRYLKPYLSKFIATIIMLNGLANIITGTINFFNLSDIKSITHDIHYIDYTHVQQAASSGSIIIGIVLLLLGRGLLQYKRESWIWTEIILLFLCVLNYIPRQTTAQAAISLALFLILLACYPWFNRRGNQLTVRRIIALLSILFSLLYGIIGTYLLRSHFHGVKDLVDAVYFTVVTYTTVGYGDIIPVTENARLFTISMIIVGVTTFVTAITVYFGPVFAEKMRGVYKLMKHLEKQTGHIIVAGGDNDFANHVGCYLKMKGEKFLLLTPATANPTEPAQSERNIIYGEPSNATTLKECNLLHAKAIIAADASDAENILISLTAAHIRESNKSAKFKILCCIFNMNNIENAKTAGADNIISPSEICTNFILDTLKHDKSTMA